MCENSTTTSFDILSKQLKETYRLAATIAPRLRIGDVLLLTGDLACGKTYFVKGLADALGCTEIVTSPTYALVHTYGIEAGDLMHIDAYRLEGTHEFMDLGLEEYLVDSITAIEWGEKVRPLFDDYLSIAFHLADADINHRMLRFSCCGERWATEMDNLREAIGREQP